MGRAPCCDKNGLKKGPWTTEEDNKLVTYIQMHGPGNWRSLPKNAGLERCGKSCRLRWTNYLRPDIKRGRFSFEEEETIIQLHSVLGNKWSAIAARLPGRTDNEIKNYWNTHIRKRLLRNGIDPVTHVPRLDLLDLSSILTSALCDPAILNLSNLLATQQALLNPEILLQYLHNNNNSQSNQIQNQLVPTTQQQNQTLMQNENPDGAEISHNDNILSNFSINVSQGNLNIPNDQLNNEFGNTINPTFSGLMSAENTDLLHHNNQNFSFDNSVMSTPLSSPTRLNSSSTHNINSTEDERESYCSSLLKFEIPGSLDISDFL